MDVTGFTRVFVMPEFKKGYINELISHSNEKDLEDMKVWLKNTENKGNCKYRN